MPTSVHVLVRKTTTYLLIDHLMMLSPFLQSYMLFSIVTSTLLEHQLLLYAVF